MSFLFISLPSDILERIESLRLSPSPSYTPSMSQQQFHFQAQPTSVPAHLSAFPRSIVPSQPTLYPPGTDPYTNSGLYYSTHVGLDAPAGGLHANPNVDAQSWITKQVVAVRYDTSSSVPSCSSNIGNSQWANQPELNYSAGNVTEQGKLVQSVRCEVCDIVCNNKDIYDKHVLGKKHWKNLQMKNTAAIAPLSTSNALCNVSFPAEVGITSVPQMIGAMSTITCQELEMKKRKLLNGGASADSVRLCTICNVACNSQEAFNKHLYGKRHRTQANLMTAGGAGPIFASIRAKTWTNGVKKTKTVQSTWCEVCKINCTSNDVYTKHLLGKKHQKNLENFANPSTTSSMLTDNPGAVRMTIAPFQPSEEDLEAKRQKVVAGGAAASAVKVCMICNVVCNSQKVFDFHISGQKHQAMVKKQADVKV